MIPMSIAHHIVGVHFLPAWRLANSVAFPMRPSVRIFFPRESLVNRAIPYGMIARVIIAVSMRLDRMNMRLDTSI